MRVFLTKDIELTCPLCKERFTVQYQALNGKLKLTCPFCSELFHIYDALPPRLRRKVYYSIRNEIETKVYLEYRRKNQNDVDEWGQISS